VALAVSAVAGTARAQVTCPAVKPDCSTLTNVLYVMTADTQENMLKGLGHKLNLATSAMPTRLVYKNASSCTIVGTMVAGQTISGDLNYIPDDPPPPATAWDEKTPCVCTQATPVVPDVASSAIFTESCGMTLPATLGKFRGPLQPYLFAVRKNSTQTAITADEAYFVYGFGAAGMATPWLNDQFIFTRPNDASTLICLAAAAGIPPSKAKGVLEMRSADMITAMTGAAAPDEATIGILGTAPYDKNRANVKSLAFKMTGQYFAYYPDSTTSSFDKLNMRQGRYFPWSVTDWLTKIDALTMQPVNAKAAYLIGLITDQPVTPAPGFDPLQSVMSSGLVPACAMQVTRSVEAGDLSLYDSPTPCGCAWDAKFSTTSCTACSATMPCASGVCRHGYCEKK
jgi:hypothetical protein